MDAACPSLASPAPTYGSTGLLESVSYPSGTGNGGNATTLSVGYDAAKRRDELAVTGPGSAAITSDHVVLSDAGRIASQTIDGASSSSAFTYDGAGRLTTAALPSKTLTYGFAATGGGPLATAGANTNRTSLSIDGADLGSKPCGQQCFCHGGSESVCLSMQTH